MAAPPSERLVKLRGHESYRETESVDKWSWTGTAELAVLL